MHMRTLLLAALVILSAPVAADFEVVTEAHEVRLDHLRLPGTGGGTLSFKPCLECAWQTVRVSPNTRYEANGRVYTLEGFRSELQKVADPESAWLTVMQHVETNTITAVEAVL